MTRADTKRKKRPSAAKATGLGIVMKDVTARHGAAVNEHLAAYDGVNYEAGFTPRARMQKSFKSIAKSKVNRQFRDSNLKQQSGFDAEVIEATRARAKAAAKGKRPDVLRMDDAGPKGARHSNDQFIDITKVDAKGNPMPGSGYQMKFIGGDPGQCLNKLLGPKCRKYLDNGVDIAVPSDYYSEVKSLLDARTAEVEKQIKALKKEGKPVPESREQQLEYCKKLKRRLRKSNVTNDEAMEARLHPKRFTAKQVARQAHDAGMEGAKVGAGVAGVLSGLGNLLAVARGEKNWKEAAADTAKDALIAGAGGYFTAAGGSAISGVLMKSSSSIVRAMGKSGLPGVAITFVVSGAATLCKYFDGDIRGSECMDELASLGTSMAVGSAAYGAAAAIPGAATLAVGSVALLPMAGAIVASMVASAVFTGLKNWAYKDAYAAEARAREIEARCAEACRKLDAYKRQIEGYFKASNAEFYRFMSDSLFMIDSEDFETSVRGANKITKACGGRELVSTVSDVDELMSCSFKIGR